MPYQLCRTLEITLQGSSHHRVCTSHQNQHTFGWWVHHRLRSNKVMIPIPHPNPTPEHQSEDYYLLSDALPEDKQFRAQLQRRKLVITGNTIPYGGKLGDLVFLIVENKVIFLLTLVVVTLLQPLSLNTVTIVDGY